MYRFLLILLPTFLLASETDIFPRTVNFIIFVALMYYWTAKHFKNIYLSRVNMISNKLSTVEEQLSNSKKVKEEAIKRIEKANKDADEIVALAKIQAKSLSENIMRDVNVEIENLVKFYEEQKAFAERKAKLEVVNELIDEMLSSKINLGQTELLNMISKKVS